VATISTLKENAAIVDLRKDGSRSAGANILRRRMLVGVSGLFVKGEPVPRQHDERKPKIYE